MDWREPTASWSKERWRETREAVGKGIMRSSNRGEVMDSEVMLIVRTTGFSFGRGRVSVCWGSVGVDASIGTFRCWFCVCIVSVGIVVVGGGGDGSLS